MREEDKFDGDLAWGMMMSTVFAGSDQNGARESQIVETDF